MGREAHIHVIYDGPATVGGRLILGAREQFSTNILARVSAGMWQRLAPIVDPAPTSSPLPGRVHVDQDGDAHPAQAVLMTDAEAADWLTTRAAGELTPPRTHHGPRGISHDSPGARYLESWCSTTRRRRRHASFAPVVSACWDSSEHD
ncbi:hypothetical protein AB0N37_31805 [Streptomyces griseoincarnatus]|uniref:hypothetical protein n=1 Tax=Streptomyces sp. RK31 TaxID=2824892 RepID=UPI001B3629F2|nr:hypothetical protein [Streptomyces sp. RK31]MBQ0975580.1 hypothetical protein [Streptomyces sp. RK31]